MPEYLVISELIVAREQSAPHRPKHLEYLERLKKEGRLKFAARYKDGSGGVYLLGAESLQEADEMARNDPYHRLGLRRYMIKEWERVF